MTPKAGDIQIDEDGSEWVVIGATRVGISRVRRNSLAHRVHAQSSPEIARSYVIPESHKEQNAITETNSTA